MRPIANVFLAVLLIVGIAHAEVTLTPIGVYETGIFDEGATEITAFDPMTDRAFSVNGDTGAIDVLDLADPTNPTYLFSIDVTPWGDGANSVDVAGGIVAAAVEADVAQDPGRVVFFESGGTCDHLNDVAAGALPDMLTFSDDGLLVLVACEGEPDDDYVVDPEGSVTIVDLSGGVAAAVATEVGFAGFNDEIDALRAEGVRIYGPGATVAQDLEPEYVNYDDATGTAYVSCQENNALVVVDVATATAIDVVALGFKDHGMAGYGLDASDRDDMINITTWPVLGMYQPDAVADYTVGGEFYLVTANEGDSRDYDGYSEEERVEDLTLDPTAFPDAATLQLEENLGRLGTTSANGDTDGDGDFDVIYSNGARSFSIWDAAGNLVFDSGDQFEQITADLIPGDFNSNNDENGSFDSRSDAKGPEPEGVAVAEIDGLWYAIIGMERVGGLFLYEITDPAAPVFLEYVTTRDFSGDAEQGTAGGLGPEGIEIVPAEDSPVGQALAIVSNEVSGSIDVFLLDELSVPVEDPTRPEEAELPMNSRLVSVYPNPFNPITNIEFAVPRDMRVQLEVVDVRGRHVETLVAEAVIAGQHSVTWTAENQPSGVYFARLVTEDRVQVRRLTLVK
ncbi:T9SS type A sorting domain-containing protein [bacterium]|nr:T9SS type A sorting domain-containing protein [bacterium]